MFQKMYYNISSSLSSLTRTFFQTSTTSVGVEATIQYIQSLKVIRLFLDNGPGFGNQAASTNLYKRLREIGFKGVIELVYPYSIAAKLETLLNTKIQKPDFLDRDLNIRFMEISAFSKLRDKNQVPAVELGMAGAIDNSYKSSLILINPRLFTSDGSPEHFLNIQAFIQYSSYHGDYSPNPPSNLDTEIVLRDHDVRIHQIDSRFHALITPQISGELARQKLISEIPAFSALLPSIDKGAINVLPVYGWSSSKHFFNLFNILSGARYAQVNKLMKPLIMVLLYDFPKETHDLLIQCILSETLAEYFSSKEEGLKALWGPEYNSTGAVNIRESIKNLTLTNATQIRNLSDLNQSTIDNLDKNKLIITTAGSLSQDAFHYIYSYLSPFMLAPAFEGASSFKHLSTTSDRPHLYCAGHGSDWPLNFSPINGTTLHQQMMNLTKHTCVNNRTNWLNSWETMNVAELIGTYFLTAQDPQSEASGFFRNHHRELLKSDRIMSGLIVATQLANRTQEESLGILTSHLYHKTDTVLDPVFIPMGSVTEPSCDTQPSAQPPKKDLWTPAQDAVGLGVISGVSDTLRHGLQKKGFSYQAAEKAKQVAYYVGVFGWNFYNSFSNKASSENAFQQITESAVEAGINTGKLLVVSVGTSLASKALDLCGAQGRVGRAAQFVKGCLRYGMFAANSIHDPQAAVVSLAVGGVSEAATVVLGKKIVDLTFNKSPSF